jgi:hypothetical protein
MFVTATGNVCVSSLEFNKQNVAMTCPMNIVVKLSQFTSGRSTLIAPYNQSLVTRDSTFKLQVKMGDYLFNPS